MQGAFRSRNQKSEGERYKGPAAAKTVKIRGESPNEKVWASEDVFLLLLLFIINFLIIIIKIHLATLPNCGEFLKLQPTKCYPKG
jgi:hypothetical protein